MNVTMLCYKHPMLLRVTPTRNRPGDTQLIYRFRNGYGASVVQNGTSYGSNAAPWELAVIRYSSEHDNDWELCYSTPITDDVVGHLEAAEVFEYLNQVGSLPPDAQALPGAQLDFSVHISAP